MTLYVLSVLGVTFSVVGGLLTGIVKVVKTIKKKEKDS